MSFIDAFNFAELKHRGQVRKYIGTPYIEHPIAVARIIKAAGGSDLMVQAAMLHDVVEDCGVDLEEVADLFGREVSIYVAALSDKINKDRANRKVRKNIESFFLENSNDEILAIKLADLIHNSMSICLRDKEFSKTYLKEKKDFISRINIKSYPPAFLLKEIALIMIEEFEK